MHYRNKKHNEQNICKIYEERFIIEKQNLKILSLLEGGVIAMSANFLRGVIQMRVECVQGEGGGKKRPKNCVRT